MDNNSLRELAKKILIWQTEDVEFLTVWEVMWDHFEDDPEFKDLPHEEIHKLALKVDELVRTAIVTVEIPDESL